MHINVLCDPQKSDEYVKFLKNPAVKDALQATFGEKVRSRAGAGSQKMCFHCSRKDRSRISPRRVGQLGDAPLHG